jgi:hypothetical protein
LTQIARAREVDGAGDFSGMPLAVPMGRTRRAGWSGADFAALVRVRSGVIWS